MYLIGRGDENTITSTSFYIIVLSAFTSTHASIFSSAFHVSSSIPSGDNTYDFPVPKQFC